MRCVEDGDHNRLRQTATELSRSVVRCAFELGGCEESSDSDQSSNRERHRAASGGLHQHDDRVAGWRNDARSGLRCTAEFDDIDDARCTVELDDIDDAPAGHRYGISR